MLHLAAIFETLRKLLSSSIDSFCKIFNLIYFRGFGERVFNDLSDTWWLIGLAYIAAAFISFLWIVLMRFLTGIMVWTSIGLIFSIFGGLFGYTLYKYTIVKDLPTAQGNIFQVMI